MLPLAPLTGLDVVAAAMLTVAVPMHGWIEHQRDKRREAEGRGKALIAQYREALIFLWGATAVVLAIWVGASRPLADLGLATPAGLAFWGATGFAVLASAAYASQIVMLRRSAKARAQLAAQLDGQAGVKSMLPTTRGRWGGFVLSR